MGDIITWLSIAHIAVLGYWLGSEFVINSTYRYVCHADDMSFDERSRLMDHVMGADQHVRYALVLQATLGSMLAVLMGYFPGSQRAAILIAIVGVGWLVFVEVAHRRRRHGIGRGMASFDRLSRYVLLVLLLGIAAGVVGTTWAAPDWLRWKLAAFAGVIACGVGIRIAILGHFRIWEEMAQRGVTPERNASIKKTYVRATSILALLWVFIAIIVFLSVAKPA